MKLIETKTLGTAAASIEFTSIPQTFTDLVLVVSGRSTGSLASGGSLLAFRPNGSSSNLSRRSLTGDGSAASSASDTTIYGRIVPSDHTASTFGNSSFYIPNYTGSTNKSVSVDAVSENNATAARIELTAGLWSQTTAITSITILSESGNLDTGTTASLYGILKGSDGIVTTS